MTTGESYGSSYWRRVKASGDGSVSSGSTRGSSFRVARGKTPRCYCGAYAIVVEIGTEKIRKDLSLAVLFTGVFQCDGHGGEDDDALAEKVKKLKESVDAFEKKNKNAVENRRWFGCCSPVFFFILGFVV